MKIRSVLIVLALAVTGTAVYGGELRYFDHKIDFWGEKDTSKEVIAPIVSQNPGKEAFAWKTYLDPKNKEFFKEGDYTPPEPFMEIARDPSDENIKNWFEFMRKKNELSAHLQDRMQEYMAKNQTSGLPSQLNVPIAKSEPKPMKPVASIDPSRFRIRMYFDSHCPHCKRMFSVLKRLRDEGYQVEALQVDGGPVPEDERIVPLGKADPGELKKRGGSAVPYLLIADIKRQALLPGVQGYHEFDEVIQLLREASRG